MTAFLWSIDLCGEKSSGYTGRYLNQVFVNFYIKTFDYKAEVFPGLKCTIKYWYEL